jgi:PAS domain S-box-containing protein
VSAPPLPATPTRRHPRWTPRAIIICGVLLALLCDAFVAQVLYSNYRQTYDATERANADLVRVLEEYTLRTMQGVELLLREIEDDFHQDLVRMVPGDAALIENLKLVVSPWPAAQALIVLDADGNLVADSLGNGVPGRQFNFADRPYFQFHRDHPDSGLFIDIPHAGRANSGQSFIAVSRALRTPDGHFQGVAFVALDVASFQRFFRSLNVGREGTVNLWREDGTLLVREPFGHELAGTALGLTLPLFTRYLSQSPQGSFEGPGLIDGTVRQVNYRKIEGLPLVVSIAQAKADFLAGWQSNAAIYGTIALALNLLIVGFGVLLARQWRLRETSEGTLGETVERYRVITDNLPALIIQVDDEMRFRFVNRVAEEWYALPAAELIGRKITDFFPPERYAALRPTIEATMAGQPTRIEQAGIYPDGKKRSLDYIRVPQRGGDGKAHGYFGLAIDITARKRAEDAAKKSEEQYRQALKMEAVGQLTGGVAHDFNNLLGVVVGNLDLLLDSLPQEREDCRALVERAIEASEKGADLTRRLLAFARKQTLRPQVTEVNDLVREVAAILGRTITGPIEVKLQLQDDLWKCVIDPSQLENALLNLAINARDAMPDGGRLTIATENETLDNSAIGEGEASLSGDYVMIAVSDTGTGMAPQIVRRAFEPFFTTKEVGKGTGLGLSMVYGFVRQSGGMARIYSEVGHGTTVKLYLPCAEKAEKPSLMR